MTKLNDFFNSQTGLTIYLVTITLAIVVAIFMLWPSDITSKVGQKVDSSFAIKDSVAKVQIKGEFKPEISALLKDSSTLSLNITRNDKTVQKSDLPLTPSDNRLSEKLLLLLILLVGAAGSSLHGIVSISNYIGNKTFDLSWSFWYKLRPFVGAILSLFFYLVIRAGFYKVPNNTNFYTILAISGLVGLFSKQALNKLSDLFDVIFKSDKDDKLGDKMIK